MTYFSDFYFTSNLTDFSCPGLGGFECLPPKACARDPNTGTTYCCDPASDSTIANAGVLTGAASMKRLSPLCVPVSTVLNICWNKERSPLRNISIDVLEDVYSSLTSEASTARTWAFDPATLLPATSTPSSSVPLPNPTTTDIMTPSPPSIPDNDSSSDSLSGGAIAGIVVGVVGGIAIVVVGVFLLMKRRRQRQNLVPGSAPAELAHETPPKQQIHEVDGIGVKQQSPQELSAH
ncbi:hypothetical protein BJX63DRAFT_426722 [Aspergillus granulosus]|uniref:Uncharacterized protein n=1 Tax=Aspergillus granulosus TaxID=176169 RepID=A0ABR4I5B5_9EURO